MQQVACAACQTSVPTNEAFSAADRTFCRGCLEKFLSSEDADKTSADGIARMLDPTVCINCSADNGDVAWETLGGLPTCPSCTSFFRNRPFPKWLKVSAAIFLCVAVAAFAYNWRFFIAYVEYLRGLRMLEREQVAAGAQLLDSAARRLPEIPEMGVLPNLLIAHELIAEDKNEEALARLDASRPYVPEDLRDTFLNAEIGAKMGLAFNAKDYDTMISVAREYAASLPNESVAAATVASALACKYAVTGDEAIRTESLAELERARALAGDSVDQFREYEQRIQHRLATREIITKEEFAERFPNGWKPEAAQP